MTLRTTPAPIGTSLKPVRFSRADNAFLPAALEILETPLSPIRVTLVLSICAFVTLAVVWAYLGRIDIIAVAQGKVQAVGRTKIIEPIETGKVSRVLVENGQRVHAGERLITLDASEAAADEASLTSTLDALDAEILRRNLAIERASARQIDSPPQIAWPRNTPADVARREQRVLEGDLAQLGRTVGSLESQRRAKLAERNRLTMTIDAQQRLVATLKERVDMRTTLLESQSGSRASVIDAEESYRYQDATLAAERGQAGEIEAGLETVKADIDKAYAAFVADNVQRLATAERDAEDARQKLRKARLKTDHAILTSPIDGTVQGLSVTTVGQVVSTGEQIMEIVPEKGRIEVEAYLPNADAGFVKPGQEAIVKVEAFPFVTYGTLEAHVVRVGRDAIPMSDAAQKEENPTLPSRNTDFAGAQRMQNLVYPVTLSLDQSSIAANGERIALTPGMAVMAEVKTGRRRILEYLFSPIVQIGATAFKER